MPTRFTGTFEELKDKLAGLAALGEWRELSNQKQFRHRDGGILNWFPSTGTVSFQGTSESKSTLEATVTKLLASEEADAGAGAADDLVPPPEVVTNAERAEERPQEPLPDNTLLGQKFSESELVIGLVGAVGTDLKSVADYLEERLRVFGYSVQPVRVSRDVIPQVAPVQAELPSEFERISAYMDAGNIARAESGDNSILALGVAARIAADRPEDIDQRGPTHCPKRAYIVSSLKHPEEVTRLREIYPQGFYLLGVHSESVRRHRYLTEEKRLSPEQADAIMARDEDEHVTHGQRTSDTFHMSDFFVRLDENHDRIKHSVWRILDVLFGHPYVTPTFDEYAMFMAFSASLRSADLSRQVGAVVTRDKEIIATGANDCPTFGGGLYWPCYDEEQNEIVDVDGGRDHTRGEDANKAEQQRIIDDIVALIGEDAVSEEVLRNALGASRISDITEYGRVVHAEMEALLSCARSQVTARGATLYCTTFPCHNCAKHIIAAGIERVVYVEPYPKSKAAELHSDSISLGFRETEETVHFEPFVGVGPRRFFDLFSMRLGSGYPLKRKGPDGQIVEWTQEGSRLRIQMLPCSYLELELLASSMFNTFREAKEARNGE